SDAAQRRTREYQAEREKIEEELKGKGLDPLKEKLMNSSAAEAEWKQRKAAKRAEEDDAGPSFGWDQYNPEAHYNAHKKRLKALPKEAQLAIEYKAQKESAATETDFYRDADYLGYGRSEEIAPQKLEKMASELKATIAKR